MAEISLDGSLRDWSELADHDWEAILVGNGLSINVSRDFGYASLFKEAGKAKDGLHEKDREIFKKFDTTNFEEVLAKLRDSIAIAEVLGRNPKPMRRRFYSVQAALGAAVRRVHLERDELSDETLGAIKKALRSYRTVFTTSYDLIIYWAIVFDDKPGYFCDCFWANVFQ